MEFDVKITLADCITWVLTITGFCIAIYQFISQMNKDRENRKKENKTTWFLNVIVFPHLNILHEFYKNLCESIENKKGQLDQLRTLPHDKFIEHRANAQNEIKKEIAKFFDFLSPLISSYSNSLGLEILAIKNELEDKLTEFLENEQLYVASDIIIKNKQKLLQKLNSELSLN